jgi:hypothetical protein
VRGPWTRVARALLSSSTHWAIHGLGGIAGAPAINDQSVCVPCDSQLLALSSDLSRRTSDKCSLFLNQSSITFLFVAAFVLTYFCTV